MKSKILIVDDDAGIQKALVKFLSLHGYTVESANDGAEAIEKFKTTPFNLVLSDLKMPTMTGIELIHRLKEIHPRVSLLIMTGFATIETAVEAIKAGAFHYITKPFQLDDVLLLVEKALKFQKLEGDNEILKRQIRHKYRFDNIIGQSEVIHNVLVTIEKVSQTETTVLITGESGTGKELVARAIHYNSRRGNRPLIPVSCAAIPEGLLESELFGHVKGAFTGAVSTQEGKFVAAQGGTIFLDEIGDMSPKLQVKLLRVLQERRIEPLGSTQSIDIDVRIIAATNQDLEALVQEGRFREDLFYRLNVIPVVVPPLRERQEDVLLLANYFIEMYSKAHDYEWIILNDQVKNIFKNYRWPGNVRELENTIERLVVLKHGREITLKDLPEKFSQLTNSFFVKAGISIPDTGISLRNIVDDFEDTLIRKALDKTDWNKNRAARLLHLNRTTLVEKIKKKKIVRKGPALSAEVVD